MVAIAAAGVLALATKYWRSTPPSTAAPTFRELDQSLLAAIRNGDHVAVAALLDQGADVHARDEIGDTALMRAVLHADPRMMELLLERGANLHARGLYEVTSLIRAAHDPEKVKILLDRSAKVDDRAMVLAAMVPGSRRTLELLFEHGGQVNAAVGGYSVLMAAAYSGDLEAAAWLVEHGANVNARSDAGCTALNGAAVSGSADLVRLLLAHGADPNVRYEEPDGNGDFQTPAMNAAWHGDAACLKQLLDGGADINVQGGPFDRTPLLCAATTGSEETVRLLLAKKADILAQDWKGDTPLDWARLRGDTPIVQLLAKANSLNPPPIQHETKAAKEPSPRLHDHIDSDSVRKAVKTSLPLLQRTGQRLTQSKQCITCHQHSLVAMTVGMARQHGFAVDDEIADAERGQVQALLGPRVPLLLLGADLDPSLAAYCLAGLGAEQQPSSALTDALIHFLVLHQHQEGYWSPEAYRPPDDSSAFLFTALAARGLNSYASKGRRGEIADRIARARNWFLRTQPVEMVDAVGRLFGLKWTDAAPDEVRKATDFLLRQQRPDGGWAQLPTLASDAHATGQVLVALHEAGSVPATAPAYRRGLDFLLKTQLADGSWFVPTRCFPALTFSQSGFPHGRSQFISASATCWATMALIHSDDRSPHENPSGRR
jgi:ankyrin repeat protein